MGRARLAARVHATFRYRTRPGSAGGRLRFAGRKGARNRLRHHAFRRPGRLADAVAGGGRSAARVHRTRARLGIHGTPQRRACRLPRLYQQASDGVDACRGLRVAGAVVRLALSDPRAGESTGSHGRMRSGPRPPAGRGGLLRPLGEAQRADLVPRRNRPTRAPEPPAGRRHVPGRRIGAYGRVGADPEPLAKVADGSPHHHRFRVGRSSCLSPAAGAACGHAVIAGKLVDGGPGVSSGGYSLPGNRSRRHTGTRRPRRPPPRARCSRPRRPRRTHCGIRRFAVARGSAARRSRSLAGGLGALARPDGARRGRSHGVRKEGAGRRCDDAAGHGLHRPSRTARAGPHGGGQRARPGLSGARNDPGRRRQRGCGDACSPRRGRSRVRRSRLARDPPRKPLCRGGAQRGGGRGSGRVGPAPRR